MEGTVPEEDVVKGPLVERSVNEKTVVQGTITKKWEAD